MPKCFRQDGLPMNPIVHAALTEQSTAFIRLACIRYKTARKGHQIYVLVGHNTEGQQVYMHVRKAGSEQQANHQLHQIPQFKVPRGIKTITSSDEPTFGSQADDGITFLNKGEHSNLGFDDRWTGREGSWSAVAARYEDCKLLWKKYMAWLYYQNIPSDSVEAVREASRTPTPRKATHRSAVSAAQGSSMTSDPKLVSFIQRYPECLTSTDVWETYDLHKEATLAKDLEDEAIAKAVQYAWQFAVDKQSGTRPPTISVLQEALKETVADGLERCQDSRVYLAWLSFRQGIGEASIVRADELANWSDRAHIHRAEIGVCGISSQVRHSQQACKSLPRCRVHIDLKRPILQALCKDFFRGSAHTVYA